MNQEFHCVLEGLVHVINSINEEKMTKEERNTRKTKNNGMNLTYGSSIPCLPYEGDILDTNLYGEEVPLWSEDCWTEERVMEAQERIEKQGELVNTYWKEKYEQQGSSYWHAFYKRNNDHFYKDRHYIHLVFPELDVKKEENRSTFLLEVGSGVGNAVLPLIELNPSLHVQAIDCARSAIEILSAHPLVKSTDRLHAKVCDIIIEDIPKAPVSVGYDYALCMFVLSALSPKNHRDVMQKLSNSLRIGGKLLLRDYGRYDEAQLRFGKGSKLDDNFYVRQDGTCAYFFSIEELKTIAKNAGFVTEECYYIQRQYANRKQFKARYRVWIHAKFRRVT